MMFSSFVSILSIMVDFNSDWFIFFVPMILKYNIFYILILFNLIVNTIKIILWN